MGKKIKQDYTVQWHSFIYHYYSNIHPEYRDAVVQEKNKTKKGEDDKRFLGKLWFCFLSLL